MEIPQELLNWAKSLMRKSLNLDGLAPKDSLRINQSGDCGIGVPNPTAKLHISKGNEAKPPFKIDKGTLMSLTQIPKEMRDGAIETDGIHIYWTDKDGKRWDLTSEYTLPIPLVLAGNQEAPTLQVANTKMLLGDHTVDAAGKYSRITEFQGATWWYAAADPNSTTPPLAIDTALDLVFWSGGVSRWNGTAWVAFALSGQNSDITKLLGTNDIDLIPIDATHNGTLNFYDQHGHAIVFRSPETNDGTVYVLPAVKGTNGQVLEMTITGGIAYLSWVSLPDISGKMDLVAGATAGHMALLDANGQAYDGGPVPATGGFVKEFACCFENAMGGRYTRVTSGTTSQATDGYGAATYCGGGGGPCQGSFSLYLDPLTATSATYQPQFYLRGSDFFHLTEAVGRGRSFFGMAAGVPALSTVADPYAGFPYAHIGIYLMNYAWYTTRWQSLTQIWATIGNGTNSQVSYLGGVTQVPAETNADMFFNWELDATCDSDGAWSLNFRTIQDPGSGGAIIVTPYSHSFTLYPPTVQMSMIGVAQLTNALGVETHHQRLSMFKFKHL